MSHHTTPHHTTNTHTPSHAERIDTARWRGDILSFSHRATAGPSLVTLETLTRPTSAVVAAAEVKEGAAAVAAEAGSS